MEEGGLFNMRDNDHGTRQPWVSDQYIAAKRVRIIVLGDAGSGKTSLIVTALAKVFLKPVASVLEPFTLPEDLFPGSHFIDVIDTCADDEERYAKELKNADVVLLTFSCNEPEQYTLDRLSKFWLPRIREIKINLPVVLVGCKFDLRQQFLDKFANKFVGNGDKFNQVMPLYLCGFTKVPIWTPLYKWYPEIEMFFMCSAFKRIQIGGILRFCQKAALYSRVPLYSLSQHSMTPRLLRALKLLFIRSDPESTGFMNHEQFNKQINLLLGLNEVSILPSGIPAIPEPVLNKAIEAVKPPYLQEEIKPQGVTFRGFLWLYSQFLPDNPRPVWHALLNSGFRKDLKPSYCPIKLYEGLPDLTLELTSAAIKFLSDIFKHFDGDQDGLLQHEDYERMFRMDIYSPFRDHPYKDAAERDLFGRLSLNGFLSEWALVTLLDPLYSIEILKYIGFKDAYSKALAMTRERKVSCKINRSGRKVSQCFVFGPRKSGKSHLLDCFLKKGTLHWSFCCYNPTTTDRYAVNVLDFEGYAKTLVLREIPEDDVKTLLSNKTSLAGCDVAVCVHDSSDHLSWERATQLLVEVVRHGEDTGYEVPCLIIAAKSDLNAFYSADEHYKRVTNDMGMPAPISISTKANILNDVFIKILKLAQYPVLNSKMDPPK